MNGHVISKPYYDDIGFDTHVFDLRSNLFAVFDGMGTSPGARAASEYCRGIFKAQYGLVRDFNSLRQCIASWTNEFIVNPKYGGTTAVCVFIDDFGNLHYAHVGDSRLYIVKGDRVHQVTADEGYGNVLSNYIGRHGYGALQYGVIDENKFDGFMLCSDGITGDWPPQYIDDGVIEAALCNRPMTPEDKCEALIRASKKNDDKTVMVVFK